MGSRLLHGTGYFALGMGLSEAVGFGENMIVQKYHQLEGMFHRTDLESTIEGIGLGLSLALCRTGKPLSHIPVAGKYLALLPFLGSIGYYAFNRTKDFKDSQVDPLQSKANGDLNTDFAQRSANLMRKAIQSYTNYGFSTYTISGDPTNTKHDKSNREKLAEIASEKGWDKQKGVRYGDNKLEYLRGGAIVKTAYADAVMKSGTLLSNGEYILKGDNLDFGAEALKSLVHARRNIMECAALTQQANGKKCDGTVIDAQKETNELQEVQNTIDSRIAQIQGRDSSTQAYLGHNIAGAFNELARVSSSTANALSVDYESLTNKMRAEAAANRNSADPFDHLVTSKQLRDLALWQLANLSPYGSTANIQNDQDATPIVNNYRRALMDLQEAKIISSGIPNPDIEKTEHIAQVLAGKALEDDQNLQATANKIDPSIKSQLARVYEEYDPSSKQVSPESGAVNQAQTGNPSETSPNRGQASSESGATYQAQPGYQFNGMPLPDPRQEQNLPTEAQARAQEAKDAAQRIKDQECQNQNASRYPGYKPGQAVQTESQQ